MSRSKKQPEIPVFDDKRPYILWRRVSTEGQGASGLGLEAQVSIAKMFMGRDPVEIYTDVYSGTKLRQCKNLWEAIERCKNEDLLLVIAKSDRLRNVHEALEILDAVGQNRLIFCDIPSSDRFILTVMWSMWERQAIMGRINTKIALAERKKQIARDGGFVSKSGRWCNHLGRKKGECSQEAITAMARHRSQISQDWKKESELYSWVTIQVLRRRAQKDILEEAIALYEKNPKKYVTRAGKKLNAGTLSRWAKEIRMAL